MNTSSEQTNFWNYLDSRAHLLDELVPLLCSGSPKVKELEVLTDAELWFALECVKVAKRTKFPIVTALCIELQHRIDNH